MTKPTYLSRQHRNQRERRARRQADHVLTGIVNAIGAGEVADWLDDTADPRHIAKEQDE